MHMIEKVLDTLQFPEAFTSTIYCDKYAFGTIVIDLIFNQVSIKMMQCKDEIQVYICPKEMPEYTFTLKEVLLALKVRQQFTSKQVDRYLIELSEFLIEHWNGFLQLFKLKDGKPTIAQFVYQSDRTSVWKI